MKKALKIIGIILLVVVVLIGIGATYIQVKGIPSYEVNAPKLEVKADSAMVAEGKRLATMVCNHCHMKERKLQGGFMEKMDLGELYAPNITQHPNAAIAPYTDGELAFLLRTGIKRDGLYAPPYMPKFPHLSDKDLHSVIAFLRSDEPEVQPVDRVQPKTKPSFLTKFLSYIAFKPLPFPEKTIEAPSIEDKVAYGKYLATAKIDCSSCHSADFTTVDIMQPENSVGYFGGGNEFNLPDVGKVYSANLTPDKETGIGNWTEAQFIEAIRFGKLPSGKVARLPMMPYTTLTEEEAATIWAYLQTIPAIKNEVKR